MSIARKIYNGIISRFIRRKYHFKTELGGFFVLYKYPANMKNMGTPTLKN